MLKSSIRRTSVCAAFVGLLGAMTAGSAVAQEAAVAVTPSAPIPVLTQEQIDAFKASPAEFLARHPLRGITTADRMRAAIALSGEVRDLAVADITTVDLLIELSKTSTPEQQRAIGAGLNRAAQTYVATKPELATLIQEKVAASGIMEMQTAFLAGNLQTAAFFGAAGGGARQGAGSIGGGSGPGTNFIEDPVATQGAGFVVLSSGGSFFDVGDDDDDNDDDSISPVQN